MPLKGIGGFKCKALTHKSSSQNQHCSAYLRLGI
jgi:hypothetical protein